MSKIVLSPQLSLPIDFVTQTQAILAIKRVGKTYSASVEAEELLKAKQQVVAIDITGAWWGLRSNAAGDGPGFPITIFGGDHGDLPLEKTAGEMLAEAIVSERFNAILDVSLLRKSESLVFLVSFLETLYRRNREAMHLFCDEADFYAPQKPYGEEIKTLGAMNDIVLRGGIKGIGCTLITQRPTRINKDVLTQCGILTCLRMSHPRDLEPIEEWVSEHAMDGLPEEMRRSLPSLPIGTAWVWSSGWPTEDGIFKKIQIRKRFTYDSGATPKAGQALKSPKVMAPVDLAKLGEKMAATVQRVKENDPTALKRELAELRRKVASMEAIKTAPITSSADAKALEKKVKILAALVQEAMKVIMKINAHGFEGTGIDPQEIADAMNKVSNEIWRMATAKLQARQREFEKLKLEASAALARLQKGLSNQDIEMTVDVTRRDVAVREVPTYRIDAAPTMVPRARLVANAADDSRAAAMTPGERAILIAVCQFGDAERDQLTVLTGYKRSSRDTYIQRLSSKGFLEVAPGQPLRPTQDGVNALGSAYEPLPTGHALYRYWAGGEGQSGRLSGGELEILRYLVETRHGDAVRRDELDEPTGYKRSSRDTYIQRLMSRRLIEIPQPGAVQASQQLFDSSARASA